MATQLDTSRAKDAPREGLPPCYRKMAVFDGRVAKWGQNQPCEHFAFKHVVAAGEISEWRADAFHEDIVVPWFIPTRYHMKMATDDEAEALAAWNRAEIWVRTGRLPDDSEGVK